MGTSLAEVLETHGRALKAAIHTSLPAVVKAYNPVTNVVLAQPSIKAAFFKGDGEREYDTLPVVPFPVLWPRFGGKVIRGLLEPGDHVLLVFSEAGLAEWRATGQMSEPRDARRLSIGYGFAIPGAYPDVEAMSPADAIEVAAGALIIGEDGGDQMLIGGTVPGIRFGKLALSPVALAIPTNAGIAGVVTAINALIAVIAALIAALATHTHVAPPGGGPTAPPVYPGPAMPAAPAAAPAAATVASTLVKSV